MRNLTRKFRRSENGTASIEFVILFPLFIAMLLMSIESGLYMVRQVMLDRSLDLAVRELRLGTETPPTFEEFKTSICNKAFLIPECENTIQVELRPVPFTTWQGIDGPAKCRDVTQDIDPYDQTEFLNGSGNELMMVQVCGVYKPIFPTTALGLGLQYMPNDMYAIVTKSAFVNEPS